MNKRRPLIGAAIVFGVVASLFAGTAAWAGTGSYNWAAGNDYIGGKSPQFSFNTDATYVKARLNTGAKGGFQYTNPVYSITEVQFQLQRNVNGWVAVGNKQANTNVYMNWGNRIWGVYRFQLNGVRFNKTWAGEFSDIYLTTGVMPYNWG